MYGPSDGCLRGGGGGVYVNPSEESLGCKGSLEATGEGLGSLTPPHVLQGMVLKEGAVVNQGGGSVSPRLSSGGGDFVSYQNLQLKYIVYKMATLKDGVLAIHLTLSLRLFFNTRAQATHVETSSSAVTEQLERPQKVTEPFPSTNIFQLEGGYPSQEAVL
ncbi:unnamed protein product [Boreogadus saida]